VEFGAALRAVLVEASTAWWEVWFGLLGQFKEAEGHCRVPQSYILNGFNLGNWVALQRTTKDRLSPERRWRLDDLGFVWDLYDEAWEEGFNKLLQFKEAEGHCRVPSSFKLDAYKLGTWVVHQRTDKVKRQLSAEQKQKLEEAGFIWDPVAEAWEEAFEKLKKYFYETGNSNVKKGYVDKDGFKLANWVHQQRHSKDSISVNRKKLLEAIDFDWDPLETKWKTSLDDLLIFKKHHGHVRVPATYKTPEGNGLGAFVCNIRKNKEKLSKDRIQALDALGFTWDPRTEDWEKGLSKLLKFKEREGHCKVPQLYKEGDYNLGSWVSVKRRDKHKLTSEHLARLDSLGFIWSEQD
jgi:hypothetical protein